MGAMASKAGDVIDDVLLDVAVDIIVPHQIVKVQDINFATIATDTPGDSINATMADTTGVVTSGSAHPVGTPTNGRVELIMSSSNLETISLDSTVTLTSADGDEITYTPSFAQIGDTVPLAGDYVKKTYGIGGTLSQDIGTNGHYTGQLHVTLIADTGSGE